MCKPRERSESASPDVEATSRMAGTARTKFAPQSRTVSAGLGYSDNGGDRRSITTCFGITRRRVRMVGTKIQFDRLEGTQKRGQATEAIIKAELVLRDIPVLIPEYDNEPYDFVIEVDDSFLKIQAKTGYQHGSGKIRFETASTRVRSDGYERDGYEGEIDFFAVFNPILEETYLVHVDEAATGKMEIRYEPPKNNQRKGVNWHEDFLIGSVLGGLTPSSV